MRKGEGRGGGRRGAKVKGSGQVEPKSYDETQ